MCDRTKSRESTVCLLYLQINIFGNTRGNMRSNKRSKRLCNRRSKGCIYCSFISNDKAMTIEKFAVQLLFLPNEHKGNLKAYCLIRMTRKILKMKLMCHGYTVCIMCVRNKFHLVYMHNPRHLTMIGATIIYDDRPICNSDFKQAL